MKNAMREIKFRAWDAQEKKWYAPIHKAYKGELHSLMVGMSGDLFAHTARGVEHESIFLDRYILSQYTGLKDKNGVEIYEGDLLGGVLESLFVGWCDVDGSFEMFGPEQDCFACSGDVHWRDVVADTDLEVIGNIYENPELLGERNETDN